MTEVDKTDPVYLAGRADMAREIAEAAKPPLTVEAIKKMTPEQIIARKDEVDAVMAGGER